MKKGSDFSSGGVGIHKEGSQKTKCFGHGRRKMFVLQCVFEGGVSKKHANYTENYFFVISEKKKRGKGSSRF